MLRTNNLQNYPRCDSNAQPLAPEANAVNPQHSPNKALTNSGESVLASCLAQIVQKYPELRELVKFWPGLPEHVKDTIKALIKTHR